MTQKELLYVEDAVSHEKTIIKICEDAITKCDSREFTTFIEEEINKHQVIMDNLMALLTEVSNE